MKLNDNFVLYDTGEGSVLISVGETEFSGVIHPNKTAEFIIHCLKNDIDKEEILDRLTERYSVSRETASRDTDAILDKLRLIGALDG